MAGREGAHAGDDVVRPVGNFDGLGQVDGPQLAIDVGLLGDLEHARGDVDAVNGLCSCLRQGHAGETGAAARIEGFAIESAVGGDDGLGLVRSERRTSAAH